MRTWLLIIFCLIALLGCEKKESEETNELSVDTLTWESDYNDFIPVKQSDSNDYILLDVDANDFEILDESDMLDLTIASTYPQTITFEFEDTNSLMVISAANDIVILTTSDVNRSLNDLYEYLAGEKPSKQVVFEIKETD